MKEILIIGGGLILFLLLLLTLIKIKRSRKEKVEANTSAMIDQMSFKRAAINTAYMEDDFFKAIQNLVYSFYGQSVQALPTDRMLEGLYMDWYNKIKRDYDLGIKRVVYSFEMNNARVVKQDNSSMHSVSEIEIDAEFVIDNYYNHVTLKERKVRRFKQKFVFVNTNNSWLLSEAQPERNVEEEFVQLNPIQ